MLKCNTFRVDWRRMDGSPADVQMAKEDVTEVLDDSSPTQTMQETPASTPPVQKTRKEKEGEPRRTNFEDVARLAVSLRLGSATLSNLQAHSGDREPPLPRLDNEITISMTGSTTQSEAASDNAGSETSKEKQSYTHLTKRGVERTTPRRWMFELKPMMQRYTIFVRIGSKHPDSEARHGTAWTTEGSADSMIEDDETTKVLLEFKTRSSNNLRVEWFNLSDISPSIPILGGLCMVIACDADNHLPTGTSCYAQSWVSTEDSKRVVRIREVSASSLRGPYFNLHEHLVAYAVDKEDKIGLYKKKKGRKVGLVFG